MKERGGKPMFPMEIYVTRDPEGFLIAHETLQEVVEETDENAPLSRYVFDTQGEIQVTRVFKEGK